MYMSLFTLPASEAAPMIGWLSRAFSTAEVAAPVGSAAVTSLISAAGQLTRVKGGVQGFVKGNPKEIFEAITKGATKLPSGAFKLADGTFVRLYSSSTSGEASIAIKTITQEYYKIRILP